MNKLGADSLYISDLIEASVDGIFLLDDDCKVIAWNPKMVDTTGLTPGQVMGRPIFTVSFQFGQKFFLEGLKQALNNSGNVLKNNFHFATDGSNHICQASLSPFNLPFGEGLGCMVILRKVSQKFAAHGRMKHLIEESPIATAIYHKDGRPRYFNKAYGDLWGANSGMAIKAITNYNILEDDQLVDLGIMPFIEKGFAGSPCDIPIIAYNPYDTPSIKSLGINEKKFIKGHIFPVKNANEDLEEVILMLTDITFQRQADEILSETHLKFQMLTMGLPGVIYEYEEIGDNPHKFRYISQGCQEMFGFSPEEIMEDANKLELRIHPDDLATFRNSTQNSEFEAKNWEWQGRIIVDGEEKWIEGKSSPAKLKDGTIVRYGLLLDITDKKEVEHQYKLTQERLTLALEGAELGLWEWKAKSGRTFLNKSWAAKLGYSKEEFDEAFKDWKSMIHPDDVDEVRAKMERHITGKSKVFESEYRVKKKSGDWFWVLDKGKVTERSKKGEVKKSAGTLLDINDSKITQNIIEQNEQLFSQLFDNAPMGIVLLDDEHKVVQMNSGFEKMFGFGEEDIIGNQLNHIIVPEDKNKEAIDINIITAKGTVGVLESKRLHKNGSLIPVIIYGVPVSFNNKTIGIYGIYVDITDRVNVEHELQIRNNELDNFVYKVSHDLRAPLSSILGLVHLASHDQNEDDIRQYISIIEDRLKQLDSFINDVLSHSKNLKMDVAVNKIDFKKVIEDCFEGLGYLRGASNIDKFITVSDYEFYSDEWRVNEIFRNLISNAIKYLNTEVSNSFIKIDIDINANQALIKIEDNGIGIDESALPKIFDMFFRATTSAEGSGIGLYIVKNAIEKLGGNVNIESAIDKGTTFTIILPNTKDKAAIKA
ncbi:MAG: PAS domain S-box protein [Fulvivirga sp.]